MSASILVVGSGIYGVTAALELHRRGHSVTLTDPGPLPHPDAASTDISKVIRMDYGADLFYMEMMEEAFPLWDQWNREWGEPLYHETGFTIMSSAAMAPGTFEGDSLRLLEERGHRVERLTGAQLRERCPVWTGERFIEGYHNPRAGWAESGNVVRKLIRRARDEGVILREGVRMAGLMETDSRVTGIVTTDGERITADESVIAAGAWTPVLLPQLSEMMWPVGQPVFHFRVPEPARFRPPHFSVWAADLPRAGWYGFPALADGTLKVANHGVGRRVHPGDPRVVDPAAEAVFRSFLRDTFPSIADAPVAGTRLCLYCDSWDGNFYIDRDPDRPGLSVSAGGSGHAFKFAPLLGGILADVIEGKPNPRAARFAWRKPGDVAWEDARNMTGASRFPASLLPPGHSG